jgi:glutathione peroxidase-family protein
VDYAVRGIPEKFFIDAQGRLVKRFIGPSKVEGLREILDQMLAGEN